MPERLTHSSFCNFIKLFLAFLLLSNTMPSIAQRPQYKISATLDTSAHTLKGKIDIRYTNTSKNPLDKLAIHLWPNAYKERNTALIHQKLHQHDLKLYRARPEDLGGLYDLNFISAQQSIQLIPDSNNIDIGWLHLSQPLLPGQTIDISSPYTLKIPKSFSRIGRTGKSYQLTQWYPHIAVYEDNAWHAMPYIDQGEYYNDFADYEVVINAPAGFIVAATGSLISKEENGYLAKWTWQAVNVIDFAWFASPDLTLTSRTIEAGAKKIELKLYVEKVFNEDWKDAMLYAERALKFYSDWLGPYPYEQMSVVHTPFSKAGYMEYPMVAQIGYTDNAELLDRVIAHEIGHTWLYGILANNERKHPWMDEGLNTFVENEYMQSFYSSPREYIFPDILHSKNSMPDYDALQHMLRATGELQPPVAMYDQQQSSQYIFSVYFLPLQGLQLMKSQVGDERMKEMFRRYFEEHKFSHVSPGDLKSSFENTCACDLNWFFKDWLHHAHEIDYRIKSFDLAKHELTIENKSTQNLPLLISEFSRGKEIEKKWFPGFAGTKKIQLDRSTTGIKLYDGLQAVNSKWTHMNRPRSFFPSISLIPKVASYDQPSLSITPVIGYNYTDGGMPGLAFTSSLLPQPKLKFFLMPMYGLESEEVRLYGEGRYITDLQNRLFDKLLIGASITHFGYNLDTHYLFRDNFTKLSPAIGLRLKKQSPFSHYTNWLKYRYVNITQQYGQGVDFDEYIYSDERRSYGIHELAYQISSDTVVMPFTSTASIQVGKGFIRLNIHYNQHFRGKDKMKGVWVHGFAGWLPVFNQPDANVVFTFNGLASNGFFSKDYMYDEWLLGRNVNEGNLSRQIFSKDAGLKTLSTVGISKDWMVGGGLSMALPLKVVHVYMDGALYRSGITNDIQLSYSGGLSVILMKDAFEIYIPVLESRDIRESLSYQVRDRWFDRISFMANFKMANPLHLVDRFQFRY